MKILVLNSGSSSLKFDVYDAARDSRVAGGRVERIGEPEGPANHGAAIAIAFGQLGGALASVEAVGHRIVHGGERFREPVLIDSPVEAEIEKLESLAPLHEPHNLEGYRAARAALPGVPHVAVFDTAFHGTLPAHAYLYGLPAEFRDKCGIRRYGFHGTSHHYLLERFANLNGKLAAACNIITLHLGNGCSACTIKAGRSVDTSMGFTPLEGLLMGTRCGDLDPGVLLHLLKSKVCTVDELESILWKKSGLLGMSALSLDMRDLLAAAAEGNAAAREAVDLFCYRIRKAIGAYLAAAGPVEAIVFAGGIGENAPAIREQVCDGLEHLGITLNREGNLAARGVEADLSASASKIRVWVIPTKEELMIARQTEACVNAKS